MEKSYFRKYFMTHKIKRYFNGDLFLLTLFRLLAEELDGPNAGRIRDAWVIAVER